MDTPVFTKKQQKKTLSAKKTQKETIKNVLASPYHSYWPLINNHDLKALNKVLKEHLPEIHNVKANVPWREIKCVPKEKRKEFRENYCNKTDKKQCTRTKDIVFGVNSVTKMLEKKSLSCVLIASSVKPKLLTQHVVDMCVLNDVPVLVVDNLREQLKSRVGFGSVVMAVAKTTSDPDLLCIAAAIREINCNYPVPNTHINFERSLKDAEVVCTDNDSGSNEEMEVEHKLQQEEDKVVLLFRKDKNTRVFVPELSDSNRSFIKADSMEVDVSGFVPFSEQSNSSILKPLVVKRVKSNKDRYKKKVERLKVQRK